MDDNDRITFSTSCERSHENNVAQSRKKERKRTNVDNAPSSGDEFDDSYVKKKKTKHKRRKLMENGNEFETSSDKNVSPRKEKKKVYPFEFYDSEEEDERRKVKKKKKKQECADSEALNSELNCTSGKKNSKNSESRDSSHYTAEVTAGRHNSPKHSKRKNDSEIASQEMKKYPEDNSVVDDARVDSDDVIHVKKKKKKKKKKTNDANCVNTSHCDDVSGSQESYFSSQSMDFLNLNIYDGRKSKKLSKSSKIKNEKELNSSGSSVQVLDNCAVDKKSQECITLSGDSENVLWSVPSSQVNKNSKDRTTSKSRRKRRNSRNAKGTSSLEVSEPYDHERYEDNIFGAQVPIFRETQFTQDDGGIPFTMSPIDEIYKSPPTALSNNSIETSQAIPATRNFHSQSLTGENNNSRKNTNEYFEMEELENSNNGFFASQRLPSISVEDEDIETGLPFTASPVGELDESSSQNQSNASDNNIVHTTSNWLGSEKDIADLYIDISWKMSAAQRLPFRKITKTEEERLKEKGFPIKTGPWTRKESERLNKNWATFQKKFNFNNPNSLLTLRTSSDETKERKEIIKENKEKFVQFLGKGLDKRSLWSIYAKARDTLLATAQGCLTPLEQEKLQKLVKIYGCKWRKIGKHLNRSGSAIHQLYKRMQNESANGLWTEEEDKKLISLITAEIGRDNFTAGNDKTLKNLPWSKIAAKLGTRNYIQCRNHWLYNLYAVLLPENKRNERWKPEHNLRLIERIKELGVNEVTEIDWDKISEGFPVFNSYCLRRHWESLKATVDDHKTRSLPEILRDLDDK